MSVAQFINAELAAAAARGVRQCVVIGPEALVLETLASTADHCFRMYAVDQEQLPQVPAVFVPTHFASEGLATALERSDFDRLKASLFIWLGNAKYRTLDAVIASLSFVASLPGGSAVVLDYAVERRSLESLPHTALDALASRISAVSGSVRHLIEPQAVSAMLRSIGFQKIIDLVQEEQPEIGGHLVSALV